MQTPNICPSLAGCVLPPAVGCLAQCNWCFNGFLSWQSKIPGNPLLVATLNSCSVLAKCPWTQLLTEILACLFSSSCFCSSCVGSFCLVLFFLCCRYIPSLVPCQNEWWGIRFSPASALLRMRPEKLGWENQHVLGTWAPCDASPASWVKSS